MNAAASTVALTGGTGYIGGRLLPLLEDRGVRLRCLTRRPGSIQGHVSAGTQIAEADVLDPRSLGRALQGVATAYYLVHSMGARGDFEWSDRQAAANFAAAAKQNGVRRIIYLGGLGDSDGSLSAHLRSRQEVGDILRTSGAQVFEFRASIIIGSGSLSFELIRALVERLPVMICPRCPSEANARFRGGLTMVAPSIQSATRNTNRLRFEQMLPQILVEVQRTLLGVEPRMRRRIVAQTVKKAFTVFTRLADRGMADIVYPKPLALAAVKQVAASAEFASRERG